MNDQLRSRIVSELRGVVGGILHSTFGKGVDEDWKAKSLRGKLSVEPDKTTVNRLSLVLSCGYLSEILRGHLILEGYAVDRYCSAMTDDPTHTYLSPMCDLEIVIDVTIGQYVPSHLHVFVGTKDELRNLILSVYPDGVEESCRSFASGEEMFEKIWGSSSIPRRSVPVMSFFSVDAALLWYKPLQSLRFAIAADTIEGTISPPEWSERTGLGLYRHLV